MMSLVAMMIPQMRRKKLLQQRKLHLLLLQLK